MGSLLKGYSLTREYSSPAGDNKDTRCLTRKKGVGRKMFHQKTKDAINGWGTVLRFVTPVLVTIMLWIAGDMRNQIRDVREATKELAEQTVIYNTNHLTHHLATETSICERLSNIEGILKAKR